MHTDLPFNKHWSDFTFVEKLFALENENGLFSLPPGVGDLQSTVFKGRVPFR